MVYACYKNLNQGLIKAANCGSAYITNISFKVPLIMLAFVQAWFQLMESILAYPLKYFTKSCYIWVI